MTQEEGNYSQKDNIGQCISLSSRIHEDILKIPGVKARLITHDQK